MSDEVRAAFMDTVFRVADRDDVDYYRDRAQAADGPVLELGCGTGRIYLDLLEAGIDIDGLDLSAASLAYLREQAADRDLNPTVWQGDMTDISADREYALVTCPFNAIQELTEPTDRRALLESVHDVLAPGGTFVFDTFVPDFEYIAETWGEWQERPITFRGENVAYRTRTSLTNPVTQAYRSEKEAIRPNGEQLFSFTGEATLLPYEQLEWLATLSPFEDWTVTGNYTDEPLNADHRAQVWSLTKRE